MRRFLSNNLLSNNFPKQSGVQISNVDVIDCIPKEKLTQQWVTCGYYAAYETVRSVCVGGPSAQSGSGVHKFLSAKVFK